MQEHNTGGHAPAVYSGMTQQQIEDALQIFCPKALRFFRDKEYANAFEVLLEHLIAHDKALQSLTPGGSEYVNDRDRCVAHVRQRLERYQGALRIKRKR